MTQQAQMQPSLPVAVGVGYGWNDGDRWEELRGFLKSVVEDAQNRARRAAQDTILWDEDQDAHASPDEQLARSAPPIPAVRIARLRATPGRFVWPSIKQHIDRSDILVFDITQTSGIADASTSDKVVSPNVWLELGYALGTGKPVYLTHRDATAHRDLPSDLSGMMIGHVPKGPANVDRSLRMSLVMTLRECLIERACAVASEP